MKRAILICICAALACCCFTAAVFAENPFSVRGNEPTGVVLTADGSASGGTLLTALGKKSNKNSDIGWIMEDKSDEVDSLGDALSELAKGAVRALIYLGLIIAAIIALLVALRKKAKAKKAAKLVGKAVSSIAGKAGEKAAEKAAEQAEAAAEKADEAPVKEEPAEETMILKDPATGAETLYTKDADGYWVSADGSSVLDPDKLPEWQKQRADDRAWQNRVNEQIRKPSEFTDIDQKYAEEVAQIERDSYMDRIAINHGVYGSDIDTVYEKVSADQGRAEKDFEDWSRIAKNADTAVKIAENLKTTADYSVSALGAVTGPAGTVVKDVYTAGTTIGGDVSQAIADGKDAYDVAQAAAGATVKTAVGVIQNHATGVIGKASADISGGAVSGGIDAYVKGQDVGQGITKGTVSGAISAMVDTGGEMLGALKDGSALKEGTKDFLGSVSDAAGDLMKNTASDAVNDSFDKTFAELNPKK